MLNEKNKLRILFLEDSSQDVELMEHELELAGFKFVSKRVFLKKDFLTALSDFKPDIIIADYTLPMFNGMHAFRLYKEQNIPIPFILVTGSLDEELSLDCLKEGVDDFVLKSNFKRLPFVISRNLEIKRAEAEKKKITEELEKKSEELKKLKEKAEKERVFELLSPREFEILCLIAKGKAIKEIADDLHISPATVATHRSHILEKMDLKSNVDIARYVLENKLTD